MKKIILLFIVAFVGVSSLAYAKEPMDVVKKNIEEMITILKNTDYKKDESLQTKKFEEVVDTVFDFEEISRRSLGGVYKNFTPEQFKEFTSLFSNLLKNTYLKKFREKYNNQKVEYLKQEMKGDSKALIMTNIVGGGIETPIDYSMKRNNDIWKIYDIKIEGISLVQNYRSQFTGKKSSAKLIEQLREMIRQLEVKK
ncbi:MAG: ABC transporter substrate-binding protein [bacterium]